MLCSLLSRISNTARAVIKEMLWEAYREGYDSCLPNDLPNHENNPIWDYIRKEFEKWFEEKQNNPCGYKQ